MIYMSRPAGGHRRPTARLPRCDRRPPHRRPLEPAKRKENALEEKIGKKVRCTLQDGKITRIEVLETEEDEESSFISDTYYYGDYGKKGLTAEQRLVH